MFCQGSLAKRLGLFVAGGMIVHAMAGALAADEWPFTVTFSGTPGVEFVAECVLETSDGTVPMELSDAVPRQYDLLGQGLECRISRPAGDGRLTVEINKADRSISRASVSGGAGTTRISVR